MMGRVAVRLVSCPAVCADTLNLLARYKSCSDINLSTVFCLIRVPGLLASWRQIYKGCLLTSFFMFKFFVCYRHTGWLVAFTVNHFHISGFSLNPFSFEGQTGPGDSQVLTSETLPLGAISLFATGSPEYFSAVAQVINKCNHAYNEFLKSEEGNGFIGQVGKHVFGKKDICQSWFWRVFYKSPCLLWNVNDGGRMVGLYYFVCLSLCLSVSLRPAVFPYQGDMPT